DVVLYDVRQRRVGTVEADEDERERGREGVKSFDRLVHDGDGGHCPCRLDLDPFIAGRTIQLGVPEGWHHDPLAAHPLAPDLLLFLQAREETTYDGSGRVLVGKLEDHLLMERRDLGHGRAPYPPKRSFVNRLLARGRHWHGPWTDLRRVRGAGRGAPPARLRFGRLVRREPARRSRVRPHRRRSGG